MAADNDTYPRPLPPGSGPAQDSPPGQGDISDTQQAFDKLRNSASETVSNLRDTVSAAAMEARAQATSLAADAAETVKDEAAAVGSKLPWLAGAAQNAADDVEQASQYIRDAAAFRPITSLAVSALAGLILGHVIHGLRRSA